MLHSTSIASKIADLADRQRIEQTYAQGATQVYGQALQVNCSPDHAATMDFFIPQEMRIVNKVLAKIRLDQFRAYSKATSTVKQDANLSYTSYQRLESASAGEFEGQSTQSGGLQDSETESVVMYANSTSDNSRYVILNTGFPQDLDAPSTIQNFNKVTIKTGVTNGESEDGRLISHTHSVQSSGKHTHNSPNTLHYHTVVSYHKHTIAIPNHKHEITIPNHRHDFTIPAHNHEMKIPAHTHQITPGIYKFGDAKSFRVYINGVHKATFSSETAELDVTELLAGNGEKIERGKWFTIGILPDDLAYVSIVLMVQGFIQSRGTYNA